MGHLLLSHIAQATHEIHYRPAKPAEDGAKRVDIAIPAFGHKNHIGIDRAHGFIRTWRATGFDLAPKA
jgi:hypothetical protein